MLSDYIESKPTIETLRLILRPLKNTDIEDLKTWTHKKEIYTFWGKNPGKTDLNPELLLEKKPSKSFHLRIELKNEKKVIGDIYIYLIEKNRKAKVAVRIDPLHHNKGLGTEAVSNMVKRCFEYTELENIWTDVDVRNKASIRLLEKCKFIKIAEVKQGKMVSTICDYSVYEYHK